MSRGRLILALSAVTAITACGGGSGSPAPTTPPPPVPTTVSITGSAEKGPFVTGSLVEVRSVPASGIPGAGLLTTSVDDAAGRFGFDTERGSLIEVTVSGLYGSELNGQPSAATISLRALVEVSNTANQVARVNVLTHLQTERALTLMRNNGLSSGTALAQAHDEILDALNAVSPRPVIGLLSELSIYGSGDGDAWLLTISTLMARLAEHRATIAGTSAVNELTQLLDALTTDLADGALTDATIVDDLRSVMPTIVPVTIINNLTAIAQAAGLVATVADFNAFLDSDLDGEINLLDVDDDNDGIADENDAYPNDSACHFAIDGDGVSCTQAALPPDIFRPTQTVHDGNGVVYLLHPSIDRIYRWSTSENRYLDTILLDDDPFTPAEPRTLSFSDELNRLYIGYSDGRITKIDFSAPVVDETPFARWPNYGLIRTVISTPNFLFATLGGTEFATYAHDGSVLDYGSVIDTRVVREDYAWNPDSSRLYWITSLNEDTDCDNIALNYFDIDPASGEFLTRTEQADDQRFGVDGPFRFSADSRLVINGCGAIYNADDLTWQGAIPHEPTDMLWLPGDEMLSIRPEGSGTRLERRDATGIAVESMFIAGIPVRIIDLGERIVIITDDGPLSFVDYVPNDDSDEDGAPNVTDAFPDDPAASIDTDGDGFPDIWNDAAGAADSTMALSLDAYPQDSACSLPEHGDGVICDIASTLPDAYVPDKTVIDDGGIAYMLKSADARIYRWNTVTDQPLNPIATDRPGLDERGQAIAVLWHSAHGRLYIGYDSGVLSAVDPATPMVETHVAVTAWPLPILASAGAFLFAHDDFPGNGYLDGGGMYTFDSDGALRHAEWSREDLRHLEYNERDFDRLYGLPGQVQFDRDTGEFEPIEPDIYCCPSRLALTPPLRVSFYGQRLLGSNGSMNFASDLSAAGQVPADFVDMQWSSGSSPSVGHIVGIEHSNGDTLLVRRDILGELYEYSVFSGAPLSIHALGNDTFVIVTDRGRPAFFRHQISDDSDGDGVDNSVDAFAHDPAASVDSDGDGAPDAWNDGASGADSTTGLVLDAYPDASACQLPEHGDGGVCDIAASLPDYQADAALMDHAGIVYLLSTAQSRVFRFDSVSMTYLNPLVVATSPMDPIHGPTQLAYAPTLGRLLLGYPNGMVTYFELPGAVTEIDLGIIPWPVTGLAAFRESVLVQGANDEILLYEWYEFKNFGSRLVDRSSAFYSPELIFDKKNDRIYSIQQQFTTPRPMELFFTNLTASGDISLLRQDKVLTNDCYLNHVDAPPLRLSGDGQRIVAGSGVVYDTTTPNLEAIRILPKGFTDARWFGDENILLIRAAESGTNLEQYDGQNRLVHSELLAGTPLALFDLGGSFLAIANEAQPAFHIHELRDDNDGDGVDDADDAFPADQAASLDSDADGFPDAWNPGYNMSDSATGLSLDAYPLDAPCFLPEHGDGATCIIENTLPDYTPDVVRLGEDGIVYLHSPEHELLFRWKPQAQEYLPPIALGGGNRDFDTGPIDLTLSQNHSRLYFAYECGAVSTIDLMPGGEVSGGENRFYSPAPIDSSDSSPPPPDSASPVMSLGNFLLSRNRLFDMAGNVVNDVDPYQGSPEVKSRGWDSARSHLYLIISNFDTFAEAMRLNQETGALTRIAYNDINYFNQDSDPVRISANGGKMLLPNGETYKTGSFNFIGTVAPQDFTDAAWLSDDDLATILPFGDMTVLEQRDANLTLVSSQQFDGEPLAVFLVDDQILLITQQDRPVFRFLDFAPSVN